MADPGKRDPPVGPRLRGRALCRDILGRVLGFFVSRIGFAREVAPQDAERPRGPVERRPVRGLGPRPAWDQAEAAGQDGIHVIIDYLWGQPTEAAIAAITRRGLTHAAPRVRLVQVGQMAGPVISLPAAVLRSSGLQVLGSGPGTIPLAEIINATPEFMSLAATGDLPIDIDKVPLAEVESAWQRSSGSQRIVLRP